MGTAATTAREVLTIAEVQSAVHNGVKDIQETLGIEFENIQDMIVELSESLQESLGASHGGGSSGPDSLADRLDRVEGSLAGLRIVLEPQYKVAAFELFAQEDPLNSLRPADTNKELMVAFYECFNKDWARVINPNFHPAKATPEELSSATTRNLKVGRAVEVLGISVKRAAQWFEEWSAKQQGKATAKGGAQ